MKTGTFMGLVVFAVAIIIMVGIRADLFPTEVYGPYVVTAMNCHGYTCRVEIDKTRRITIHTSVMLGDQICQTVTGHNRTWRLCENTELGK